MINRALLRIKVVQVLYACFSKGNADLNPAEKELQLSLQKSYELYHFVLLLIAETRRYTELKADSMRNRLGGARVNEMFNSRFMNNSFARQLGANVALNAYVEANKLSWADYTDMIRNLIERIEKTEYYGHYVEAENDSYADDKQLWISVVKNELINNEEFEAVMEDRSIYWMDDFDVILSFVVKTIKQFKEENGADQPLLPMFKDPSDREFAFQLLDTVITENDRYDEMIKKYLVNWDLERVAFMDLIILKTAISELTSFPTIPVSVTLNEYIDLAKVYCSPKSARFVNGVLDKVVKDLRAEGKLNKFNELK